MYDRARDFRVIFVPLVLLISSIGICTAMISLGGHGYGSDHDGPLIALTETYFSITMVYNVMVTSAIVGKLWFVSRAAARGRLTANRDGLYKRVIVALVESGESRRCGRENLF